MIPVFPAEIELGLEKQIISSASIAYFSDCRPLIGEEKERIAKASLQELLKLGIKDFNDKDLYYNKSILVSTGWNLNDDIFHSQEVWAARYSPKDKPSNLDHNEKLICGHMTGVWAIDEFGEIIAEDTQPENLPDFFHLFTNNVIYLHWEDSEFKQRVHDCVAKIENKEKFVSMECLFSNFDYGLIDQNGVNKIIARQQNTAYLTKYLKAYGGPGIFKGMRIGRLLRNIAYSGKGYVDRPANPNSIIFSEKDFVSFAKAELVDAQILDDGVLRIVENLNTENETMPVENELENIKRELEEVKAAKAELEAKLAKADVAKLEEKINSLTNDNVSLASEIETLKAKVADKEKKEKDTEEENKKTKSELEAALAKIAEYEAKAAEFEKEQKKNKRKAQLTEVGVSNEEAEKTVSEFADVSDEKFAFIVELASRASKPTNTAEAAKAALENVEEEKEVALAASNENEEAKKTDEVRQELGNLFSQALASTKNKRK